MPQGSPLCDSATEKLTGVYVATVTLKPPDFTNKQFLMVLQNSGRTGVQAAAVSAGGLIIPP